MNFSQIFPLSYGVRLDERERHQVDRAAGRVLPGIVVLAWIGMTIGRALENDPLFWGMAVIGFVGMVIPELLLSGMQIEEGLRERIWSDPRRRARAIRVTFNRTTLIGLAMAAGDLLAGKGVAEALLDGLIFAVAMGALLTWHELREERRHHGSF